MIPFLPLREINESFQPALSEKIDQVVRSGRYLHGEETAAFEEEFARYVGTAHCVGVGNGLDALTLSLLAMKLMYGWSGEAEVIVPDMTFFATYEAVTRAGLRPVLADVDDRALLTAETAERVRSPRTKAVVPVHLYGHAAPMEELNAWAGSYGISVIEDTAQAHGATAGGRRAGSLGKMAAFSFYPGKNLGAMGDGGAVTTDDGELATLVRMLANYGAAEKYRHELPGVNSRLDELQAAVLRVKLPRLDEDNERRRRVAAVYARHISHPAVRVPYGGDTAGSVFHIYPLRCDRRDALAAHLRSQGVETLKHYPLAVSEQPAVDIPVPAPCSLRWARTELSLPVSPLLTEREAMRVCRAINDFET